MGVHGIGTAGYPAWHGTIKAESNMAGDFGVSVKGVSGPKYINGG